MSTPKVQLIFGGASLGGMEADFTSASDTQEALDLLEAGGVQTIDTARIYTNSEHFLGEVNGASRFAIDTKYPGGFSPAPSSKEDVLKSVEESLRELKTEQINVYYIHAPDRRASLEDILSGLNTAHQLGKFKRLGLSNFLPSEVQEVLRISRENKFVLPTVYQGNYNAVARHSEKSLLPLLRENNISYYAYSPIAGGFLTKNVEQLAAGGEKGTRWDPTTGTGSFYTALYSKTAMLEGLKLWGQISGEAGVSKAELAYRWVAWHSVLDG
ncbi:putative aldehyde reductase, partial [Aspergillus crustosus]